MRGGFFCLVGSDSYSTFTLPDIAYSNSDSDSDSDSN